MDLWNWDIRFEEGLLDSIEDVSLLEDDELAYYAGVLAEDFLSWIDEYGIDYDQSSWTSAEEFQAWIVEECLNFMTRWRDNAKKA